MELLKAVKVFSPFDMYEQYFESQPPWTQVRIMLLRLLGPRDFIDVDANLDGHVSASELRPRSSRSTRSTRSRCRSSTATRSTSST